jgi:hypothetical protein
MKRKKLFLALGSMRHHHISNIATYKTKRADGDNEKRFALFERTTQRVLMNIIWAPFATRRMSKRYSMLLQVFSSIGGVTEACNTLSVSMNCSNHRLMACTPGAYFLYSTL